MTQKEIKENCRTAYADINNANNMLRAMRAECKHLTTFEGNYSYRVGCVDPATICSDCGEVLKVHFGNEIIAQE